MFTDEELALLKRLVSQEIQMLDEDRETSSYPHYKILTKISLLEEDNARLDKTHLRRNRVTHRVT